MGVPHAQIYGSSNKTSLPHYFKMRRTNAFLEIKEKNLSCLRNINCTPDPMIAHKNNAFEKSKTIRIRRISQILEQKIDLHVRVVNRLNGPESLA